MNYYQNANTTNNQLYYNQKPEDAIYSVKIGNLKIINFDLLKYREPPSTNVNRGGRKQVKVGTNRRNARERNRVRFINNCFDLLRECLPASLIADSSSSSSSHTSFNKKLSKVDTLRYAIDYIRQLSEMLQIDEQGAFNVQHENSHQFIDEHPQQPIKQEQPDYYFNYNANIAANEQYDEDDELMDAMEDVTKTESSYYCYNQFNAYHPNNFNNSPANSFNNININIYDNRVLNINENNNLNCKYNMRSPSCSSTSSCSSTNNSLLANNYYTNQGYSY